MGFLVYVVTFLTPLTIHAANTCSQPQNNLLFGGICTVDSANNQNETLETCQLYTWKENGHWCYSLVKGNGNKYSSKKTSEKKFTSLTELEKELEKLKRGSQVKWSCHNQNKDKKYSMPPKNIVRKIQDFCQSLELILERE
jgi:hypothetical protein